MGLSYNNLGDNTTGLAYLAMAKMKNHNLNVEYDMDQAALEIDNKLRKKIRENV